MSRNRSCDQIQTGFSDYLDGVMSGRAMQATAAHLKSCAPCTAEFAEWRAMQHVLSGTGAAKAPADLGLKLRLAISHESARRTGHWWDSLSVRWDNILRPALLHTGAGLAGAVALIGTIIVLVGVVAAPQSVLAHDEPLGAVTSPHYLYSSAPSLPVITPEDTTIVIQADLNAQGTVYDYTILSGPQDANVESQVRAQIMLQHYEPARVFGEPVRGRVLITFAGASVRG